MLCDLEAIVSTDIYRLLISSIFLVLGEVLTHRLLFSDPAQEAIAALRVYDDLYSQTVQIESK